MKDESVIDVSIEPYMFEWKDAVIADTPFLNVASASEERGGPLEHARQ